MGQILGLMAQYKGPPGWQRVLQAGDGLPFPVGGFSPAGELITVF